MNIDAGDLLSPLRLHLFRGGRGTDEKNVITGMPSGEHGSQLPATAGQLARALRERRRGGKQCNVADLTAPNARASNHGTAQHALGETTGPETVQ